MDITNDLDAIDNAVAGEEDIKKRPAPRTAVKSTAPPKHDDEVAQLRAELEAAKNQLQKIRVRSNASFLDFEEQVKALEARKKELAQIMKHAPKTLLPRERNHRGPTGELLTYFVGDTSAWSEEQKSALKEYEEVDRQFERLLNTPVHVTLKHDPNVVSNGLTIGWNGVLGTLFYSSTKDGKGRRVQVMPYGMYLAGINSYRVNFQQTEPEEGDEGKPRIEAIRVHPTIEVKLAEVK